MCMCVCNRKVGPEVYQFNCSTDAPHFVTKNTILVNFRKLHVTFPTALAAGFAQNTTDSSFHELSNGIWVDGFPTTASHSKSRLKGHVREKIRDHIMLYTCHMVDIFPIDANNRDNIGAPHN